MFKNVLCLLGPSISSIKRFEAQCNVHSATVFFNQLIENTEN